MSELSSKNDDAAKALAKKLIADYAIVARRVAGRAGAKGYTTNARDHAAQELAQLANSPKISSEMSKKIKAVAAKVKNHNIDTGHGSWWASSGSNDNPGSWI